MHDLFEQLLLGHVTGMSKRMDAPSEQLHGQHRVLFHDPLTVGLLSVLSPGDAGENFRAGLLHIALDLGFTGGKKAVRRAARGRRGR